MSALNPRWKKGNTIGELLVSKVLGRQPINKGTADMWVYECRCACGNLEKLTQKQLVAGRTSCTSCMNKRRGRQGGNLSMFVRVEELPEGAPNPATVPVPEGIKTGPEQY